MKLVVLLAAAVAATPVDNQPAETVAKKNQPADNVAKTSDVAEPGADREGKRESYFSVIFDPCLITFLFQCSACLRLSVSTTTRARVTMARWECATRQPSARRRGAVPLGTALWASESAVGVSYPSYLLNSFSKAPLSF